MARSTSDNTPKGIHDSEPLKRTVEDYPERPYEEAVTKEHAAALREAGFTPREIGEAIEGRDSA